MRISFSFYVLVLAAVPIAQAQSKYTIVPVVKNGAPIPNSSGIFQIGYTSGFSIDEEYIAFINGGGSPYGGVWLYNLRTQSFTQLVALGDAAPGTGPFIEFGGYCVVKGLHVIFAANIGTPSTPWGYYSIPVTGGSANITVIANQFTKLPGVKTTGSIPQPDQTIDTLQADDVRVVFVADPSTGGEGSFVAGVGGGPREMLSEVAGPNQSLTPPGPCPASPVTEFFVEPRIEVQSTSPVVENVVFLGGQPSGYDILIRQGLQGVPTCLVGLIKGVVFDGDTQLAIDNKHVYIAAPVTSGGADYLYQVNFDGTGLAAILENPAYSILGLTAQFGTVAFIASDADAGIVELYAYQTSTKTFTPVIGTGDTVFGGSACTARPLSLAWNASSNGKIVFGWCDSGGQGIVVAEPPAPAQ